MKLFYSVGSCCELGQECGVMLLGYENLFIERNTVSSQLVSIYRLF
jgi:hypothetical protein